MHVVIVMTDQTDWHSAFATLVAAHAAVRVYASNASLYIHAKVVIADAGTPHQRAFVGSENFSNASLNSNRELGIETTDPGDRRRPDRHAQLRRRRALRAWHP